MTNTIDTAAVLSFFTGKARVAGGREAPSSLPC